MDNIPSANQYLMGYIEPVLIFCACVAAMAFIKWLLIRLLKDSTEPAGIKFPAIKIIKKFWAIFYIIIAADLAIRFLPDYPPWLSRLVGRVTLVAVIFYILIALGYILDYAAATVEKKQLKADPNSSPAVADFFSRLAKAAIWIVAFLTLLSNFGYNISALLTGLGIGSVAVAFALQNILTDIFSSVSIYFDRPFKVGDFIVFGNDMGTVTKIGMKSTRLETLEGQELIVSNKELTSLRINNYKRMSRRRVVFGFGVPLSTSTENVEKIPGIVKDIILKQPKATVDRVHFSKIDTGQFSFEAVYFLSDADHNFYMDTQQNINLAMLEQFRKQDINLAFPAQTIFVRQ